MNDKPVVVGFWRRAVADTVDVVILGLFGAALGAAFGDALSRMGQHGLWIGLVCSSTYFGVFHSSVGRGQTPGKRLLGIQVLRRDGQPLPIGRSYLRFLVVAMVPYNGLFAGLVQLLPLSAAIAVSSVFVLVLVWAFVACYLLVPFHPLKRGLHDLAAGSVVVYRGAYDAEALARLDDTRAARRALTVLSSVTVVLFVLGLWGVSRIRHQDGVDLAQLSQIQKALSADFDVRGVQSRTFNGRGPNLIIQLFVPMNDFRDADTTARIRHDAEERLVATGIDLSSFNEVQIALVTGYTLGIANWNQQDAGRPMVRGALLGP
jgi:uncharacterized RDD family membrane protein YckC